MFRLWVRHPEETRWHPYDAVYSWNFNGPNAWNSLTRAMNAGFRVYLEWKRVPEVNLVPDDRAELREPALSAQ